MEGRNTPYDHPPTEFNFNRLPQNPVKCGKSWWLFHKNGWCKGVPLFNQLKSSLVSGLVSLVFQNASYKCQNRQSLEELAINESLKPSTSPLEISTASSSFWFFNLRCGFLGILLKIHCAWNLKLGIPKFHGLPHIFPLKLHEALGFSSTTKPQRLGIQPVHCSCSSCHIRLASQTMKGFGHCLSRAGYWLSPPVIERGWKIHHCF